MLLACHDNDRGYTFRNRAYAHFLDSMGDLLNEQGLTTQSVALPYSRLTGQGVYGRPVSINRAYLANVLGARVLSFIRGRDAGKVWEAERQEGLWQRIIERCHPRLVIAIQPERALCRAGHVLEVPVYDLQHGGGTADDNPSYGKAFRIDTDCKDLPHGFLCWDEPSAETLRKWALQKGIDIRVVGNPWFSRFRRADPNDVLVTEALVQRPRLGKSRPTILVSLQWGMQQECRDHVTNGVMAYVLEKAILNTANRYNWLLRLHPVQIRGAESSIVQDYLNQTFNHSATVEWRQCSEVPFPVALRWADLHITHNSTATTEAAWMGVRTGLVDPNLRPGGKLSSYFALERARQIAEIVPLDTSAIEQWITLNLTKGRALSTFVDHRQALEALIAEMSDNSSSFYRC